MRPLVFPVLFVAACFGEAPTVELPTSSGAESDASTDTTVVTGTSVGPSESSTTEQADTTSGSDFCAGVSQAFLCDDLESGSLAKAWDQTSVDGELDVTAPGRDSAHALSISLSGTLGNVALLQNSHDAGRVVMSFAINVSATCEVALAGLVLASFSIVGVGNMDTSRIELVLYDGEKLGLRRTLSDQKDSPSMIDAPPRGTWTEIEFEAGVTPLGMDGRVTIGADSASDTFMGLALVDGRRSAVGLVSPGAATTCTVLVDDIVLRLPPD